MTTYYALKDDRGYILTLDPLIFTTQIDHAFLITKGDIKKYKKYKPIKYTSLDNITIKY